MGLVSREKYKSLLAAANKGASCISDALGQWKGGSIELSQIADEGAVGKGGRVDGGAISAGKKIDVRCDRGRRVKRLRLCFKINLRPGRGRGWRVFVSSCTKTKQVGKSLRGEGSNGPVMRGAGRRTDAPIGAVFWETKSSFRADRRRGVSALGRGSHQREKKTHKAVGARYSLRKFMSCEGGSHHLEGLPQVVRVSVENAGRGEAAKIVHR